VKRLLCWLLGHRKPADCTNTERCRWCWYPCPRCGRPVKQNRPYWVNEALDERCAMESMKEGRK
jgi:hypothetical protein